VCFLSDCNMSLLDLSYYGFNELPRYGKDHLALADWRLGVPHQRNRGGESVSYVEFDFSHLSGSKRVTLEGGSRVGLPTDADDLFLVGLLTLASALGFPAKFHFEPSHVLQVLRLPVRDRHIIAQRRAYERFVALTAMFHGTWFDRKSKRVDGDFITGVIAEVCYEPHRGRRRKGEHPASYVQFTDNFHQSLTDGNLINIDLELLSGWSSPTAALLFRHLNKVWHSGRKPFRYERDLTEIACGHLHMTDGKNLKENFANVLHEMEQRQYLSTLPASSRFQSIRRGIWRIAFELHPDRAYKPKTTAPKPASDTATEAEQIIVAYARARFGTGEYEPRSHELTHANALVADFGSDAVLRVLPRVVEQVKQQRKADVYFGFSMPYFRQELKSSAAAHGLRHKLVTTTTRIQAEQSRLVQQAEERRSQRAALIAAWRVATPEERARFRTSALRRAASETARRHICQSDADEPAHEVLQELALRTGRGESALLHS
jgi:hypothetical protein